METVQIARVRKIAQGKTINGVAQQLNLIVIELTNGKPAIVRNYNQFLTDLKDSFLIGDTVKSIEHPAVLSALKGMIRGKVSGNITYNRKGDKWTVTEDSRIIKDPTHPEYGTANVGDVRVCTEDSTRVEGFLFIELNEETTQRKENALSQAENAFLSSLAPIATITPVIDEPVAELPNDAVAEAMSVTKGEKPVAK